MYGVFHQKNRKQHYDSFRDPEIILFEEVNKKPCKHFMQRSYGYFAILSRGLNLSRNLE
jgi:U11/U12 small nuclear ribonucleoprotein SNRNP20